MDTCLLPRALQKIGLWNEIKSEYSGIGPFDPNSGWAIEFMYVDVRRKTER